MSKKQLIILEKDTCAALENNLHVIRFNNSFHSKSLLDGLCDYVVQQPDLATLCTALKNPAHTPTSLRCVSLIWMLSKSYT